MESLLLILTLVVLAVPISIIALFIRQSDLRARVDVLETELRKARAQLRDRTASASRPSETSPPEPPEIDAVPVPKPKPSARPPVPEKAVTAPPHTLSAPAVPNTPQGPAAPDQNGPIVMRAERLGALVTWLQGNWIYVISAISLALAGIFFVQYGVEQGLLPPVVRVIMALLLGAALIAAGEWIRRRYGDEGDGATAYLPSTFSGAGLVSMFGGVLAARRLYDLIGTEAAFAGLGLVAALAVVLGWFYGSFLMAIGLTGAIAAPFTLGGNTPEPYGLYGYFAIIAVVGLAVDAVRRWAWVSVLALALAVVAGHLIFVAKGGVAWYMLMLAGLALAAIIVPLRSLTPRHTGVTIAASVFHRGEIWPEFPTRLAGGTLAVAVALITLLPAQTEAEGGLALLCLGFLALALILWAANAPALTDLAVLPIAGFLVRIALEALNYGPLFREFIAGTIAERAPETSGPMTASWVLGMATLITLAAAWRSFRDSDWRVVWAAVAVLTAPVCALVLEFLWAPAAVMGAFPWALHALGLAGVMVVLAERFARADGDNHRRAAYAILSALSLIAFALFLLTTKGALTVALAVLVVTAAALDRKFRLPEMTVFIQIGVITLGWRLIVDPGMEWGFLSPPWEVWVAYGSVVAAMAAGLWLLRDMDRSRARIFLESGLAGFAAIFVNILLLRWIDDFADGWQVLSHWSFTLNAIPWLVVMLVQLYRVQLGGAMRYARWALATVAAVPGLGGLLIAATVANPLNGEYANWIMGPLILDTMVVAYALPALLLLAAVTRLGHLPGWLRTAFRGFGIGLLALYVTLEIRRFWRGEDLSAPGVTQPELYSYTVAMMITGAALVYQSIARGSPGLRRLGMGVIALTVAKVFLIDASGLTGLIRVVSFLALGLSLAALAWLNRWAADQAVDDADKSEG